MSSEKSGLIWRSTSSESTYHEIIEPIPTNVARTHPQGNFEIGGALGRLLRLAWKIKLDPFSSALCSERTRLGPKPRRSAPWQQPFLPWCMRRGERGVARELHFHRRREKAEAELITASGQESGAAGIHFRGHALHPVIASWLLEEANRRWVSREGLVGKGIDPQKPKLHGSTLVTHRPRFQNCVDHLASGRLDSVLSRQPHGGAM